MACELAQASMRTGGGNQKLRAEKALDAEEEGKEKAVVGGLRHRADGL